MLKSFGGLTEQLFEKPFRNMLYAVYNFAEEDRYIHRLSTMGYDIDIDSLECLIFDVGGVSADEILSFKKYIETDIENDKTVVGILALKKKGGGYNAIAIKPKGVIVSEVVK